MGNTAFGAGSTISGGYGNSTAGNHSAIPGGREMTLSSLAHRSFGFNANNASGTADMTISAANTAVFGNANLWLANTNGAPSEVLFWEAQASTGVFPAAGTNYSSFKATAQASDITYTLPANDGGADDVLLTDGTGVLSWGQVTTAEILNETILAEDIATGAVTTSEILNETILAEDIATGAVTTSEILNETILAEDIATGAVTTSEILNETILAEDIATGAVTTSEILNETILAEDIATGAVTTSEILNETILAEDIAIGAVTTSEILNETILSEDVLNNTLTSDDIGTGAVTTDEILNETILAGDIATGAVTTSEILNETILAEDIAPDAVGSSEIAANAVGNSEMADNAIGNAEMADNAIGNAEMADNAIGNAEMADNAVGSAEITNGGVAYADIQSVTDARLLGRSAGSNGTVQEITIGSGLTLTGGQLSSTGNVLQGADVTVVANAATVNADGITGVRVLSDNNPNSDALTITGGINGQTLHIWYETTGNGDVVLLGKTINVTNGGPGAGIILLRINGNWRLMGSFDN